MTTPPPADNPPDDAEPAAGWAPPGAPPPADPGPPMAPGPPPWAAPPHGHGPPPMAVPQRTNRLAIAALVTGLLGIVVVAVGLAIAAFVQAGSRGEKGRGLAAGALVASAVWVVAVVAALAVAAGSLVTADRDASGQVTGKDTIIPGALEVGDCFTGFDGDVRMPVTAVPCSLPHDGEAVAAVSLSGEEYPGDEKVAALAEEACYLKTAHLWKSRYSDDLEPYNILPSGTTWAGGDRAVICLLLYKGSEKLTSPLDQTLDPDRRIWYELKPGDCLGKWNEEGGGQRLLSCDEPHWMQVYATFDLKTGPYPGRKAADRSAERGCDKRWEKVFRGRRTPEFVSWLYPEKGEWEAGHRTVVCFGENEERPLKRSLLPR